MALGGRRYCEQCGKACRIVCVDRHGRVFSASYADTVPNRWPRVSHCCHAATLADHDTGARTALPCLDWCRVIHD